MPVGVLCCVCGINFYKPPSRATSRRHYCSRPCQLRDRSGEGNPNYRGVQAGKCSICGAQLAFSYDKKSRRPDVRCRSCAGKEKARYLRSGPALDPDRRLSPGERAIPGFPGYSANDQGQIIGVSGALSANKTDKDGYPIVCLRRDGRGHSVPVYRLVCRAWHGPKPDGMQVAHWDGNKLNSRPDNLRWATQAENEADKIRHGTATFIVSSLHPNAKLTVENVRDIRALLLAGVKTSDIATEFGVAPSAVRRIRSGETWHNLS